MSETTKGKPYNIHLENRSYVVQCFTSMYFLQGVAKLATWSLNQIKWGIKEQQTKVLERPQEQAVTPQNQAQAQQAQETVRMVAQGALKQAQQAQETARMVAQGASTQAQQAQETARMVAQGASTQAQQAQETARMVAQGILTQLRTNNYNSGAETLESVTKGADPTVLSQGEQPQTEPEPQLVGEKGKSSVSPPPPPPNANLLGNKPAQVSDPVDPRGALLQELKKTLQKRNDGQALQKREDGEGSSAKKTQCKNHKNVHELPVKHDMTVVNSHGGSPPKAVGVNPIA